MIVGKSSDRCGTATRQKLDSQPGSPGMSDLPVDRETRAEQHSNPATQISLEEANSLLSLSPSAPLDSPCRKEVLQRLPAARFGSRQLHAGKVRLGQQELTPSRVQTSSQIISGFIPNFR